MTRFVTFTPILAAFALALCIIARPSTAQVNDTRPAVSGLSSVLANTTPKLREIGANYFGSLKQSQIWINVEPELVEAGPAPVLLNLTIAFPGHRLNHQPTTVAVRAQSRCVPVIFPGRVRQPILKVVVDGSARMDLTAPGSSYQFVPSCSRAQSDTVIAQVPFVLLRQIAGSVNLSVEALGFALRFTPDDVAAWRLFVQTVEHGATIVQSR